MSQMPKQGAFLAINSTTNTADTYRWIDGNKLEKFEYLGAGKHTWSSVGESDITQLENNPDVDFREH